MKGIIQRTRDKSGRVELPMVQVAHGPLTFNETIDLTGKDVTDADFKRIGGEPALRTLILRNTPTTDRHLAGLTEECLA